MKRGLVVMYALDVPCLNCRPVDNPAEFIPGSSRRIESSFVLLTSRSFGVGAYHARPIRDIRKRTVGAYYALSANLDNLLHR